MRRRLLPLGLGAAGVLLALAPVGSADAAELAGASWWSRLATTDPLTESPQPLPVPGPTTPETVPVGAVVSEGELLVEGTPEGATAVAAMRWILPKGESSPTLTLEVADGSVLAPDSVILACRAAVEWDVPDVRPGRWEAKPVVDALTCVNGVQSSDGATVSFGLQPLVTRRSLDIVLAPGRVAAAPREAQPVSSDTFRFVFEEPDADSLDVVSGSSFEEGTGAVTVTTVRASGGSGPSSAGGASDPGAVTVPTAGTPVGAGSGPSVVASPALEESDLGAYVPRDADALLASSDAGSASRAVGTVLLLLAAAAAAWAWYSAPGAEAAFIGLGRFRQAVPSSGSASEVVRAPSATAGGLGRFTRERTEPPVPLT